MYLVIVQFTFHSRFVTGEDELEDQMALQNFYAGFFLGTFLVTYLKGFGNVADSVSKNPELRLLLMHASTTILLSNICTLLLIINLYEIGSDVLSRSINLYPLYV